MPARTLVEKAETAMAVYYKLERSNPRAARLWKAKADRYYEEYRRSFGTQRKPKSYN